MAKSLFPEKMLQNNAMTLETIASKLTYFHEQLHLIHWQTNSYPEHKAVGELYEYVQDFKDDVMEKLMGYMNKRLKAYKAEAIVDGASSNTVVEQLMSWSYQLYEWAGENNYCDVENMAQELSGKASKTKYLLTLS